MEGPTKDVQMVQSQIELIVADLVSPTRIWYVDAFCVSIYFCAINVYKYALKISRMDYTEITVDPKFHRHLIGKGGVNSKQ